MSIQVPHWNLIHIHATENKQEASKQFIKLGPTQVFLLFIIQHFLHLVLRYHVT